MPPPQMKVRNEDQLNQRVPQAQNGTKVLYTFKIIVIIVISLFTEGYAQYPSKQPTQQFYGQNGRPQSQNSMQQQQPVVQQLHYDNQPDRILSSVPFTPPSYSGGQHDPTDIRYNSQPQPQHIRSMSSSNVSRQNPTQMNAYGQQSPRRPYDKLKSAETLPKDFNPQLAQNYYGNPPRPRHGSAEMTGEPEYQNFAPTGNRPPSIGYGDRPVQQQQIPTRTVPYSTPPAGGRIAIPPTTQESNGYNNVGSLRQMPQSQQLQYGQSEIYEGRRTPNGYSPYSASAGEQLQRVTSGLARPAGSVSQQLPSPSLVNSTYQSAGVQQQRYRPPVSHTNVHYGPPPAKSAVYRAVSQFFLRLKA